MPHSQSYAAGWVANIKGPNTKVFFHVDHHYLSSDSNEKTIGMGFLCNFFGLYGSHLRRGWSMISTRSKRRRGKNVNRRRMGWGKFRDPFNLKKSDAKTINNPAFSSPYTFYNFYMLFPSYVRTQELEAEEDDEDEWDEEAKDEIAQDAGATAETEDNGDTGEAVVKEDEKPEAGVKDDEKPEAVVKKEDEKPEAVAKKEDEKPEAVVKKKDEKSEAVAKKSDDAKPNKDQKVARRLFDEKDPVTPEKTKVFEEPPKSKLWDEINQDPAEEKIVEKVPKTLDAAQEQPKKDDAVKEQEKSVRTSVVFIVF